MAEGLEKINHGYDGLPNSSRRLLTYPAGRHVAQIAGPARLR